MKNLIIYGLLFLATLFNVNGQCNSKLIEIAAANSGKDAIYLKEFKAKLEKGTMEKPVPVVRFSTMLNEGMHYRFNVANADDYEGKAVLQLYDKGKLLGSTYHFEQQKDLQSFDFHCQKTSLYKVLMSFQDGKAGCAVGILSMVMSDTLHMVTPGMGVAAKNLQVLYVGIKNPVKVVAAGVPEGSISVSITNGYIAEDSIDYAATVYQEGKATITIAAKDSTGKVKETGTMDFQVVKIPSPKITLAGSYGGLISKDKILAAEKLDLQIPKGLEDYKFKITEFVISDKNDAIHGIRNNDDTISEKQKRLIEKLPPGSTLFVKGIKVKLPDETIRDLENLGYILE